MCDLEKRQAKVDKDTSDSPGLARLALLEAKVNGIETQLQSLTQSATRRTSAVHNLSPSFEDLAKIMARGACSSEIVASKLSLQYIEPIVRTKYSVRKHPSSQVSPLHVNALPVTTIESRCNDLEEENQSLRLESESNSDQLQAEKDQNQCDAVASKGELESLKESQRTVLGTLKLHDVRIQALEDQLTRLAPSFESMRETAEQTLAPAQEISTMLQGMSELKLKMQRLEGRVAGFAIQVKEASHMETENNSEVELKYQGVAGRVEEVNGVMTTLWEMHHTLGEEVGTLRKDAETVSSDLKVLKSAAGCGKSNRSCLYLPCTP